MWLEMWRLSLRCVASPLMHAGLFIAAHACCGCASPLSMMGCAAACRGSVMSPPWQHMAHAPSACSSLVHHSTALRFLSYGPGQLVKRPSRRSTVMM